MAGRNADKAQAVASSLGGADRAIGLSCDVRDYAATPAALKETVARFGPLDIVVSGAAGNFVAPATGISSNGFRTGVARTGRIPLRSYGEIGEVAESAVFLCSDSAAYITGTILDCGGGSQLGDASDRDPANGLG